MDWVQPVLNRLAAMPHWGYHVGGIAAAEPTALAAIALLHHQRTSESTRALQWLLEQQAADGSVGVTQAQADPAWTTALALLAWVHAGARLGASYSEPIARATDWLLTTQGDPLTRTAQLGHDSSLIGWPWVRGTHSWLEPTAWSIIALKAAGYSRQARVREGVRLIADRLLPGGGCNYGNTFVLGQQLRPHLQPSGLALIALAGESTSSEQIRRTIGYLRRELSPHTTTASLSHALLGLASHGQGLKNADAFLLQAQRRTLARDASGYKLALLLLAHKRIALTFKQDVAVS